MATVATEHDEGVASLVSGIIHDTRQLMAEQLALFQAEIKNDILRAAKGLVPLAAGIVLMVPGLLLLTMAAAYWLCWMFPDLPTWAGFAIVGALMLAAAGILVYSGISMIRSINPVPEKALHELKENLAVLGEQKEKVQWQMKK